MFIHVQTLYKSLSVESSVCYDGQALKTVYISISLKLLVTLLYYFVDFGMCHDISLYFRTETIVEKLLTNWIALSLYDFLKVSTR